jgi:NADH-quinone oxidoreductase subunit C
LTVKERQASVAIEAAIELIRQSQSTHIIDLVALDTGDISLEVRPEGILAVARFLRDDPLLDFRYFSMMFGIDRETHFETVYLLESFVRGLRLQLRTKLDAASPRVDSVVSIWPGADWHERETYDMYGIVFHGHPNHQRLFLDEDFEGYPLRKSFKLAGRAE